MVRLSATYVPVGRLVTVIDHVLVSLAVSDTVFESMELTLSVAVFDG